MMDSGVTESVIEQAALASLESLGYTIKHGPEIAPGELAELKIGPIGQIGRIVRRRM